MSEVPEAGFRFPAGARNYWRPAPGPTRDVSASDAEIPAHVPPSVQAGAGPIPAPTDSRALVALSNDTSPALTERLAPSASDPSMSGQLDSDVRRLEDRINAAARLSDARLDARFARLEASLERTLQAQTDILRDLTAKLEVLDAHLDARFARLEASLERTPQAQTDILRDLTAKLEVLDARQADGDAAAKGLAGRFEMVQAERNEERRAARKRHIQVVVAIIAAALAATAAVIGLGQFGLGAVQIGATSSAWSPKEPAAKFREPMEAQIPVQAPTPAQAPAPVRPPDRRPEPAEAQAPVQAPPAPARAPIPVPAPDPAEQAAVEAPVPLPPAPRSVERDVSGADLAAVSAAVTAAVDCGLIEAAPTADGVSVAGVVRRGEEEAIRGMLNASGVAFAALRFSLQAFEGPYSPGRRDKVGLARCRSLVDAAGALGAVAADRRDPLRLRRPGQQTRQDLAIAVPVVRYLGGSCLVAAGIGGQVRLAPDPALVGAVLPGLPFALAEHLQAQAGAADDEAQRPASRAAGDLDRQLLPPAREGAGVRCRSPGPRAD